MLTALKILETERRGQSFVNSVPLPIMLLLLLFVQSTLEQILLPLKAVAAQLTALRI